MGPQIKQQGPKVAQSAPKALQEHPRATQDAQELRWEPFWDPKGNFWDEQITIFGPFFGHKFINYCIISGTPNSIKMEPSTSISAPTGMQASSNQSSLLPGLAGFAKRLQLRKHLSCRDSAKRFRRHEIAGHRGNVMLRVAWPPSRP